LKLCIRLDLVGEVFYVYFYVFLFGLNSNNNNSFEAEE
jgi:hypothetical protein